MQLGRDPFFLRAPVMPSTFLRPIHPKTEIMPTAAAIQKILALGWVGQMKVGGHRAQIHIPTEKEKKILAYNRQGKRHTQELSSAVQKELYRIFAPESGWNVIDAEWYKPMGKIFVFDILRKDGVLLDSEDFQQRWKRLNRNFLSPHVLIVPVVRTVERCLEILKSEDPWVEGLVFRSPSPGFEDTSIVRCRKKQYRGS